MAEATAKVRRMRGVDPHLPVIVGAGQVTEREGDASPLDLMVRAAAAAAEASGRNGHRLLARAGAVAAVKSFSWPVPDAARLVAAELRITPRETVQSTTGGTSPLVLLADVCTRIQAGDLDCGLLVGGEAMRPFMRAVREGRDTGWPQQPEGTAPSRVLGQERVASHAAEVSAGLIAPIVYYPLFETAVRAAKARGLDEHMAAIARLWARFAEVAAANPHAWTRSAPDADAIAAPGPDNRLAAFPYPKLMTANIQVDQGAALLVCSAAAAAQAGIPEDQWVFVHAIAAASDHWFVGERQALHRSPAIAACGRAALRHCGAGIDDVAHLDLYSCFPSAVQIAADELGIDLERDSRAPTVTGGLTFAGGPANNYVTHSLAAMTERLRGDRSALGFLTGVGWYLTKHAAAVLSARPPREPFLHAEPQDVVDALPGRSIAEEPHGPARVEAYTATYSRDGEPTAAIVSCLLPDDRRGFAKTDDPATIGALLEGEAVGRPVVLHGSQRFGLNSAAQV
jgi:acetyl-CoA C-acetyltransferase